MQCLLTRAHNSPDFHLNRIFPDLICAVQLWTSRQFVARVHSNLVLYWKYFGTPIVVKIHSNLYLCLIVTSLEYILTWLYSDKIFPYLICAGNLETSCQFVASVFRVVCSVRIVTIKTFVIYSYKICIISRPFFIKRGGAEENIWWPCVGENTLRCLKNTIMEISLWPSVRENV